MRFVFTGIGVLLLAIASGCSTPIARPLPLETVSRVTVPALASPIIDVTDDGLTVIGSSGAALTTATRIHQRLRALNIPNEIRCRVLAPPEADRTRLYISFPGGPLNAEQQAQVKQVLQQLGRS